VVFLIGMRFNNPWKIHKWWGEAFARDASLPHHPAWRAFNKVVGGNGDVGIWHETYLVQAGQYETLYGNMPRFGLAQAAEHVPVARKGETAAQRRGQQQAG
jgi:hypothetical protein